LENFLFMPPSKILTLATSILLLLFTFSCSKEKVNNVNNNSNNSNNSKIKSEPTAINLESENPSPNKNNQKSPISSPQKSKDDILKIVYSKEQEIQLCDGQLDQAVSSESSSVYPLNNQDYLVEVLCFMGAYQGNYEYILYQNKDNNLTIKPLLFKSFTVDNQGEFNSNSVKSLAGISNYNSEKKILNIYTKDRGLGDCGSTSQYQWKNDQFELIEYRAKPQCDGQEIDPENYPVIYSNKNSNSNQSNQQLLEGEIINNILEQKEELGVCKDGFQENIAQENSEVYAINNQEKLVIIHCYQGAYQGGSNFLIVNNNNIQPLYLTDFEQDQNGEIIEKQEMFRTGFVEYNQNNQTLSIFSKYAGHGGCGTSALYQWQEISFELLEYRANFNCNKPFSADNWPVIYPQ